MIADCTVSHLRVMRTGTFRTLSPPERIGIGYDILFRKVEHINRIDCDSEETGFKMKMRTG